MFDNERLREVRLKSEKTQRDVSKALGITEGSYAHYESGRRKVSHETAIKLATYFNVDQGYFYGQDKPVDKVRELINDLVKQGILKNAEDVKDDIANLILDAVKTELRLSKLKKEQD